MNRGSSVIINHLSSTGQTIKWHLFNEKSDRVALLTFQLNITESLTCFCSCGLSGNEGQFQVWVFGLQNITKL